MAEPVALSKDHALLAGRYRLVRELGAGGFGSVWEAVDGKSLERVALKELRRMDAASLYRFKQEFRSLADMTHPTWWGCGSCTAPTTPGSSP